MFCLVIILLFRLDKNQIPLECWVTLLAPYANNTSMLKSFYNTIAFIYCFVAVGFYIATCGGIMPQITLTLCRAPFVALIDLIVNNSLLWAQSTLINEIADLTQFKTLSSVCDQVLL